MADTGKSSTARGMRDDPCSRCGSGQSGRPTRSGRAGPRSQDVATCSSAGITEGTRTTHKPGPAGKRAPHGRVPGTVCQAASQGLSGAGPRQ